MQLIIIFSWIHYSGHPACCAAALKNIEILKRDKILEHVREIEPYFFDKLNTLYKLPIVGDIRGMGLMAGIECVINKDSKEALVLDKAIGSRIDEESIKLGLIIRPLPYLRSLTCFDYNLKVKLMILLKKIISSYFKHN